MDPIDRIQTAYPRIWHLAHRHAGRGSELSERDQRLLSHLTEGDAVSMAHLADHLEQSLSTLSEHADALQDRGLLRREVDPADRRRVLLALTEAGRAARRTHGPLDPDRLARAVSRLGERAGPVCEALEALASALEES